MSQENPLTSLKLRRFDVSLPVEEYDRLTALCLRNTVSRSSMGWLILHRWLDENDAALKAHYRKLSEEQGKPGGVIEHEILGIYKRAARSGGIDVGGEGRVIVKFSVPSWDNRRLIGHAHIQGVSKPEMWRRAVIPQLRAQDEAIAQFWQSACEWLGKSPDETKALLIRDFDEQGR